MPLDPKLRWVVVLLAIGLYVAAFPLVYPHVGQATGALSAFPLLLSAWFWGVRGGIWAALMINGLLDPFLYVHAGGASSWDAAFLQSLVPALVFGLIAALVGRLSEVSGRLVRELAHRERADAAERQLAVEHAALVEAQAAEARLTNLLEGLPDGFFALDAQGRITDINRRAEQFAGTSRKNILGWSVWELFPDVEEVPSPEEYERARLKGQLQRFELFYPPVNRWFEAHAHPWQDGFSLSVRDVTRRRGLEEQLRQSQKMEAIGQLAGGIAHDFNNLLTAVAGHTELLLLDAADEDTRWSLEEIRNAANRAASLTRQLLAFSRKQMLRPRLLAVCEVVEEIVPMLRRLIGDDIELQALLDPDLDAIRADPVQLQQVITNLVINARDAMPDGGAILLRAENAHLDAAATAEDSELTPGRYMRLQVTDDGHGMDAQTLARIWEPFFTTKEVGKGTGLGLATVHGIIKQSRGHIRVRSEVGQGTTFEIYLPSVAAHPEPREVPELVSGAAAE